jgi:hypothetical protein
MDPGADDDERPIGELFGQLIDDGKAYARAEADLARARVACEADRARRPLLFGAVAAALAFVALIALIMTLVLAAASLLGPLAGGLLVTLAVAGLAWLFAMLAQSSWKARP